MSRIRHWQFRAAIVLIATCSLTAAAWRWQQQRGIGQLRFQCQAALRKRDWELALDLASLWVQRAPADLGGWMALVDASRPLERWDLLVDGLSRLPDDDPRTLGLLEVRGDLLLDELEDVTAAEDNWLRMLRIDPQNARARQRLTYLYSMTLQRTRLTALLRESIRLGCEPPEAYYYLFAASTLYFSDGLLQTTRWHHAHPDVECVSVAHAIYAARAKPRAAFTLFDIASPVPGDESLVDTCLAAFPASFELRAHRIEAAIASGQVDVVQQQVPTLLPDAEVDARYWRYQGWLLGIAGRTDRAVAAYRAGLERSPLDWKLHHELAELLRVQGDQLAATRHAALASRGKQLERLFAELPNVHAASFDQMVQLRDYLQDCGDEDLALALTARLGTQPSA